jgi:hypothetical protein
MKLQSPGVFALALASLLSVACDGDGGTIITTSDCTIDESLLASGGPGPDGIPALTYPEAVSALAQDALYLRDQDRVLGVVQDGVARAYPHNILWWHEIVNDTLAGREITVSFCPLTGSGLVIDPVFRGALIEFGVSGLLFANNLVLFDRQRGTLFGPQLEVSGRCELFEGWTPELIPVLETSWKRWKELYPSTTVVGGQTGFPRDYRAYPYGSYDALGNDRLLFSQPRVDRSRPIKERVLGVRVGDDGGKGFPFGELDSMGETAAVHDEVGGDRLVVFYEAADGGTAVAYVPEALGISLTFSAEASGFRDQETGTLWDLSGRGVEGELAGESLTPFEDTYVLFWFAWRFFQPSAEIFSAQ